MYLQFRNYFHRVMLINVELDIRGSHFSVEDFTGLVSISNSSDPKQFCIATKLIMEVCLNRSEIQ